MRSCASLPPSVSATPHKPQAFGYQKHPIEIHAGRRSARSVRQRAGAALHAFILTRCLLRTRLGKRGAYSRGAFELRPQFVEYVGKRPGNPPRNVASFKNADSVATAPQLRAAACDGALIMFG